MAGWKERGYVPDSDEEDEESIGSALPRLDAHHEAAGQLEENEDGSGSVETLLHDGPRLQAAFSAGSLKSTVDLLEESLNTGLTSVRAILKTIPREQIEEDNNEVNSDDTDSPLSSLSSSIAGSPQRQQHGAHDATGMPDHTIHQQLIDLTEAEVANFNYRRSLRTRAPIQLHPYMLEDAHYRQLMKARGVKPVHVSKDTQAIDSNQEAEESQNTEVLQSSQADEIHPLEPPSSPGQQPLDDNESQSPILGTRVAAVRPYFEDLDDDLPDLAQLVHARQKVQAKVYKAKEHKQMHQNNATKLRYGKDNVESSSVTRSITTDHRSHGDSFIMPPSPPRSSSIGPLDDEAVFSDSADIMQLSTPSGLPTPLLSSDKTLRKRDRAVLSDLETSSAMTLSSHDASDSSDTEANVSRNLQNMGKRIRGVLPASWLKLDMKTQTWPRRISRVDHSPSKKTPEKGIAKLMSSRRISGQFTTWALTDSDDSESDESESNQGHNQNNPVVIADMHDEFGSVIDEVVEDNSVDAMIPPRTSRHGTLGSAGVRQRKLDHNWTMKSHRKHQRNGPGTTYSRTSAARHQRRSKGIKRAKRIHVSPGVRVLDAPGLSSTQNAAQPRFLKIAARQARRAKAEVSLPVSKKVFHLASENDTKELNAILTDWERHRTTHQVPTKSPAERPVRSTLGAVIEPSEPEEQESLQSYAQSPSSNMVAGLKSSTNALLQRMSHKQNQRFGSGTPQRITGTRDDVSRDVSSLTKQNNSVPGLHSLFPYRNRSGRGHLQSAVFNIRPAQVEREPAKHLKLQLSQPIRLAPIKPRRIQAVHSVTPLEISHVTSPTDKPSISRRSGMGSKRRSRKPLLNDHALSYSTGNPEVSVETPADNTNIGGDTVAVASNLTNANEVSENDHYVLNQMETTTTLLQQQIARSQIQNPTMPVIESCALERAIANANAEHLYFDGSLRGSKLLKTPLTDLYMSIGPYDAEAADYLEKCYSEIQRALTAPDILRSNIQKCIASLRNIVEYLDEAISFPSTWSDLPETHDLEVTMLQCSGSAPVAEKRADVVALASENGTTISRMRFLSASAKFLQTIVEHIDFDFISNPGSDYQNMLQAYNWLMVFVLQLHTISRGITSLRQQMLGLFENMVSRILTSILKFPVQAGLLEGLTRFQNSKLAHASAISNHHDFSAFESITIVRIVGEQFSTGSTASYFYSLVGQSIQKLENKSKPVDGLCTALLAVIQVVCFNLAGHEDRLISSSGIPTPSGHDDWTLLISKAQKAISTVKSFENKHYMMRSHKYFWQETINFFIRLCTQWHWTPKPALLQLMFNVYSKNGMVAFETNLDDNERNFFNHELIDKVADQEKQDYDKFLDLIQRVLDLEQNATTDDEDGYRPNKTAARLRGLVYSLLPNDGQTYRMNEDLHVLPFLKLKNNFALYLTLYRNVPHGCRPRMEWFEGQVDLINDHTEVCKLAIKVWEVVTTFETQQGNLIPSNLNKLSIWMKNVLSQLIRRSQDGIGDSTHLLVRFFETLNKLLIATAAEPVARGLLESSMQSIETILDSTDTRLSNEPITKSCLSSLQAYVELTSVTRNDGTLTSLILPIIRKKLQYVLSNGARGQSLVKVVATTWFSIAKSLTRSCHKSWEDFISPYSTLSLDFITDQDQSSTCDTARQYFIGNVIKAEKGAIFLEYRPTIFGIWINSLLQPQYDMQSTFFLTDMVMEYGAESLNLRCCFHKLLLQYDGTNWSISELLNSRFIILQHIIETIHAQQDNPESEWLAGGLDEDDMLNLLRTITNSLKNLWVQFNDDPVAQNHHFELIEALLDELEIYPFRGFKIDSWFTDGIGFPRRSQTIETMFKCRFGEETDELAKSSIVTFRMLAVQAYKFGRQDQFAADLKHVFHCTNTRRVRYDAVWKAEYSVDLKKQTTFLQVVMPAYLEHAGTTEGATVVLPFLDCLSYITASIAFRIDSLEPNRMTAFIKATVLCLDATSHALHNQERHTPATLELLSYAYIAIETVWSLLHQEDIHIEETVHELYVTSIMNLVLWTASIFPGNEFEDLIIFATKFSSLFNGQIQNTELDTKQEDLKRFARDDVAEGLARLKGQIKEDGVIIVTEGQIETSARMLLGLIEGLPLFPDLDEDDDYDYDGYYDHDY